MDCKAIFFDLDGTLVSLRTHRVPDSALAAMERARRRGIKLFLATGRHHAVFRASPAARDLRFDAFLTANGQYCFNDRELIHRRTIPPADRSGLAALLERERIPLLFLSEEGVSLNIASDPRMDRVDEVLGPVRVPVRSAARCLEGNLLSLLLYGGAEEEALVLGAMPGCKAVRWHPSFADLIPADGGKDAGIRAVLNHYGIAPEQAMAFGDAQNDMDMLRCVGLGVAMGNAVAELKAVADHVTDSVDEDGVRKALERFGVI